MTNIFRRFFPGRLTFFCAHGQNVGRCRLCHLELVHSVGRAEADNIMKLRRLDAAMGRRPSDKHFKGPEDAVPKNDDLPEIADP